MLTPVLATKLYIPPPRPNRVPRPRLSDRLNEGLAAGHKLTLISAPTGFGKSTVVSEWLTHCGRAAVWLSLDENDNDPARFWTYFIRALQKIVPSVGVDLVEILQAPQSPPGEALLTALLNEITAIPDDFMLVLDDYHVIDGKAIGDGLTFVLEHLPPPMHLVITTREDPLLPIPRLRARGQLTELRAADLRFTPSEAAEFLNQVMALNLSGEEVAALETRTEGWIAGLQLAALSLQGNQDVAGFIQAFAGDHRYIVDYLAEEVLQRQPEPIRNFLLQTSVLDQLNGPLCDAVTGQPGGQARLEALQRGNFFLIPLDEKRHWYRYHHLFAGVLRLYLETEQPHHLPALHRRASEWYEQNGSLNDAIRHALAAEDFQRAANLVELAWPVMRRSRQEARVLAWVKALPDGVLQARPVLCVAYVGTLLASGELAGVESHLRHAERWLGMGGDEQAWPSDPPAEMAVVDHEEFRRLPGSIAVYRAALALALGDTDATLKHAQRALDLAPEDDHLIRGSAAGLLGLALWTRGDLDAAHRTYARGMDHLQKAGNISDAVGGAIALADIRIVQGRLRDAMGIYKQALQLARERGAPTLRGTADMYVGMGELHREYGDLDTATAMLLQSQEQGEHTGFPQNQYRWRVAMARIRLSQGEMEAALHLLNEAERLYVGDFFPNVRPVPAWKARVWIAQGRLEEALDWARGQGLSAGDEPGYLREFERITLARLLLAQYKRDRRESAIREALGLLDGLLKAAQAGGRMGSALEILLLQALAHQALGDIPAALLSLQPALALAESEGFVRIFLDEGTVMADLLRAAATRGILPGYTGKLLGAAATGQGSSERDPGLSPAPQPLIEPLSQRELELLRLFQTELSGPEIAEELVIALSTVRTHTKSIYGKLNVNSRRAAVKRAAELGLI